MDLNNILTIACLAGSFVVVVIMYMTARGRKQIKYDDTINSLEGMLEYTKKEMVEIVKEDITIGASEADFDRLYKRKARINDALKKCVFGIDSSKAIVVDLIRGFIDESMTIENVNKVLGLDDESEPSDHTIFEILMYRYKKQYGKSALTKWIEKYNFARERIALDGTRIADKSYYITCEDLQQSYIDENIILTDDEKKDILAVLIYQLYKGFGIFDTLREMDINGFNIGTSGSILAAVNNKRNISYRANNSCWLYLSGKYIHLQFMNFGNEDELSRIIKLLIRYNNPGALTSKRGYLVNTMYDKSRILAMRPPASEYWAAFIRKFTLSDVTPEALVIKEYTHNGEIAVKLVEFLMRGQITCGITGRQGSGKTTFLSSVVRYADPRYTIRVLELAPELYLRELYPTRNILSVQETQYVSAEELQDALKKSDAALSIVGEVASAKIAARMIQLGMTASIFTIFTHHANTTKDLVLGLRNNLVEAGNFSNMETAEKQVTDVVKVDVHWDYTPDGKRYIDRISEIVQLNSNENYPEFDEEIPAREDGESAIDYECRLKEYDRKLSTYKTTLDREYYYRKTDRIAFKTVEILKYNLETDTYECKERFSPYLEKRIKDNLGKDLALEFEYFVLKNWGLRTKDDEDEIIDFGHDDLETKLKEMEDEIDDRQYEEEEQLREYRKSRGRSMTDIQNDINDAEDFAASVATIKEMGDYDIADEFSIGLWDDEDEADNNTVEEV